MFKLGTDDKGGRTAVLNISDKEIVTPCPIPTRHEINNYLRKSPFVKKKDINNFNIGVCFEHISNNFFENLSKDYNGIKLKISKHLKELPFSPKFLHFKIGSEVKRLDTDNIKSLLELQSDLNLPVIEIPNMHSHHYRKSLEVAKTWKKNEKVDTSLMAVANNIQNLPKIKIFDKIIDGLALDLSRKPIKPLLRYSKEMYKSEIRALPL